MVAETTGRRRLFTGRVTSDKMDKTVVVAVDVVRRHRVYGRLLHHTHKFKAHDAGNRCQIGDVVEIRENRPLSKEKRWVVTRILRGGKVEIPIVEPTAAPPQPAEASE
jgi:small subunit ribosomal protein S17